MTTYTQIEANIRVVPDFPKPGIPFKDISPLLASPKAFTQTISVLEQRYRDQGLNKIAAIESRGFLFGSALAHQLGIGLVMIRKAGKLPHTTISQSYELEYGTDQLEIHTDAFSSTDRVVVIDDLLATGGTAAAACKLIDQLGATAHEAAFIIELTALKGAECLPCPCFSIIKD